MNLSDSQLYPRPDMEDFKAWVKDVVPFQDHPERGSDEVLWGNFTKENFLLVGFQHKRLGVTALMADGSTMDKHYQTVLFPMFVKVDELYSHWRKIKSDPI